MSKTIVFLILLASFYSCSNDDDNTTKETYLSSYTFSFSSDEFQLQYNSENKLIGFETLDPTSSIITKINNEITRNTNGMVTAIGNTSLTYNTSKQISSIDDGTGNGQTLLEYDASGRLINQTTNYFSGSITETKNMTYDANNRIIKIIIHVVSSTINEYYKYNLSYNTQNNISEMNLSSSSDNATYNLIETQIFTYDTKKNPFSKIAKNLHFGSFYINPSYPFSLFQTIKFNYISAYALQWTSNNNLTHTTIVAPGGTISNASYEYTYNTEGYPTKVIITDEDGENYTQNFFYKIN
ncbi:hypothetical protein [Flavobacterium sp. J27]|uniref:hypothetical protein n=1 Tax=Flavobacterium sp. J27 TaxID=2060419 RepID=UPI00103178DB|nr:hypothetical protein [Flavobacterium sp. J27]